MGRQKRSIDASILESIEQALMALPNGSVAKKLTILAGFYHLKTKKYKRSTELIPGLFFVG